MFQVSSLDDGDSGVTFPKMQKKDQVSLGNVKSVDPVDVQEKRPNKQLDIQAWSQGERSQLET